MGESADAVHVEALTGAAMRPHIEALSALRIRVFREWPYLYDGDAKQEADYLGRYAASPDALLVLARSGEQIVGASTAQPAVREMPGIRAAIADAGFNVEDTLYFGESVLDVDWRGQGLGHAFFDAREAYARQRGLTVTCFCAVERPGDHPQRPEQARSLHAFWRSRGYEHRPDISTTMDWRDLGDTEETAHRLSFWFKAGGSGHE